jgi:hypothetical protein
MAIIAAMSTSGAVAFLRRRDRRSVAHLLALAVVLAAAINVFYELPSAFRHVRASIRSESATAVGDRRLAPAFNYDVSRWFATQAAATLPSNAKYAFVTGPNASASMPVTVWAAPFVTRYLLMPRQVVPLHDASWLLCYGCNLGWLHVRAHVVWREPDATGLQIARIGA